MYQSFFKRAIDFYIALLALVILFPVLLITSLMLYIANKGRVFFTQQRPGKNAVLFRVIKFKTMNDATDKDGKLLPDKDRLTHIGKFVRATSLDELPQLLNVLVGDMSLIGPRPLLPKYLPLYNNHQKRRHEVRPGITGWAQVNGRNTISWRQKFELDIWYIDHLSFFTDLKIIGLTLVKVFKREGISAAGSATISPFNGHN